MSKSLQDLLDKISMLQDRVLDLSEDLNKALQRARAAENLAAVYGRRIDDLSKELLKLKNGT